MEKRVIFIAIFVFLFAFTSVEVFGKRLESLQQGEIPSGMEKKVSLLVSNKDVSGIEPRKTIRKEEIIFYENGKWWLDFLKKGKKIYIVDVEGVGKFTYTKIGKKKRKLRIFFLAKHGTKDDPNAPSTRKEISDQFRETNREFTDSMGEMQKVQEEYTNISVKYSHSVLRKELRKEFRKEILENKRNITKLMKRDRKKKPLPVKLFNGAVVEGQPNDLDLGKIPLMNGRISNEWIKETGSKEETLTKDTRFNMQSRWELFPGSLSYQFYRVTLPKDTVVVRYKNKGISHHKDTGLLISPVTEELVPSTPRYVPKKYTKLFVSNKISKKKAKEMGLELKKLPKKTESIIFSGICNGRSKWRLDTIKKGRVMLWDPSKKVYVAIYKCGNLVFDPKDGLVPGKSYYASNTDLEKLKGSVGKLERVIGEYNTEKGTISYRLDEHDEKIDDLDSKANRNLWLALIALALALLLFLDRYLPLIFLSILRMMGRPKTSAAEKPTKPPPTKPLVTPSPEKPETIPESEIKADEEVPEEPEVEESEIPTEKQTEPTPKESSGEEVKETPKEKEVEVEQAETEVTPEDEQEYPEVNPEKIKNRKKFENNQKKKNSKESDKE